MMSTHLQVPPSHSECSLLSWSHPGPPPPPHQPSVDHTDMKCSGQINMAWGLLFLMTTLFLHSNMNTRQKTQKVSE